MKKTFTRALSLILVLVMMLGVVPMASAAEPSWDLPTDEITLQQAQDGITITVTYEKTSNYNSVSYAWTGATQSNVPNQGHKAVFKTNTAGEATVTCVVTETSWGTTVATKTLTGKIKVAAGVVPVTNVSFSAETFNVAVGAELSLTPSVTPNNATNAALTYSGYDSTVISLEKSGDKNAKIVGLKVGTTTLTVTAADGSGKTDTCTINVTPPAKTGIAIVGENTVAEGEELVLTAKALPNGAVLAENATYTWNVVSGTGAASKKAESTTNSLTIVGASAGTVTVTVSDGTHTSEAFTVTVEESESYTITLSPATLKVAVGKESEALEVVVSDGSMNLDAATYKVKGWVSSNNTIATVNNGVVTGVKPGTAVITAVITMNGKDYTSAKCVVTVAENYTVAMDPDKLTLQQGKTSEESLVVVVKNAAGATVASGVTTANWKSSDETVATVTSGNKVKASSSKTGTANITCDVLVEGVKVGVATCAVTVEATEFVFECENGSAEVGKSFVLEPKLKINGTIPSSVSYEFKTTNANATVTPVIGAPGTASVVSSRAGLVEVTVTVKSYKLTSSSEAVTGDAVKIEPLKVYVRFYKTPNVELTLAEGKTRVSLTDTKIFSQVEVDETLDTSAKDLSFRYILERLLPTEDMDEINDVKFGSIASSAPGQLVVYQDTPIDNASWPWVILDEVVFDQVGSRTGTTTFTYELLDDKGLTMLKGYCSIILTGGEGDIHYETSYNQPITLKEIDFTSFWSKQNLTSQYTLKHITFDTTGMIGTLYTDSTRKTMVLNTMQFAVTPGVGQYDLGSVYYVPASNKTAEYIDSFNFTAFDNYGLHARYGTVTVELNAKSTNITSRGVVLSTTHSKAIKDTYETNTGATLGYAVFELPEAKYGKLYTKLPSELKSVHGQYMTLSYVATGTEMKFGDKMWYDASKAENKSIYLATVAYVPAAGFKGEVELNYTAYDANGNNPYKGTLRFNVSAKNASAVFSDVTAKSYTWAADSADFLFYEGVAQGSKAAGSTQIKYNPSANITRRDFMLMLYRAFLADDYGTFNVTTNFPDVVKGTDAYSKEIYQAVGVAKYLGIAQGTNDKFNPKSNITRQEAMVLIYRTLDVINRDLDYSAGVNAAIFKDYNKVSNWAATAIIYLVNHGVIQGSNDMINPTANITRAEMACILHRVLTY